jgi:hypothetical protein
VSSRNTIPSFLLLPCSSFLFSVHLSSTIL